jgi:hypothetical protein
MRKTDPRIDNHQIHIQHLLVEMKNLKRAQECVGGKPQGTKYDQWCEKAKNAPRVRAYEGGDE